METVSFVTLQKERLDRQYLSGLISPQLYLDECNKMIDSQYESHFNQLKGEFNELEASLKKIYDNEQLSYKHLFEYTEDTLKGVNEQLKEYRQFIKRMKLEKEFDTFRTRLMYNRNYRARKKAEKHGEQ
jgi:hypothetical protein